MSWSFIQKDPVLYKYYMYINIVELYSGTSKMKNMTPPPTSLHSLPSAVEDVRIVVILFQNIAKSLGEIWQKYFQVSEKFEKKLRKIPGSVSLKSVTDANAAKALLLKLT